MAKGPHDFEGFVRHSGIGENDGNFPSSGTPYVLRPEFAFHEDGDGGLEHGPCKKGEGGGIEGKNSAMADLGCIFFSGDFVAGTGRRGENDFEIRNSAELINEGFNSQDFSYRYGLYPDPVSFGAT